MPDLHVIIRRMELKMLNHKIVNLLGLQREWQLVDRSFHIHLLDYRRNRHITEER